MRRGESENAQRRPPENHLPLNSTTTVPSCSVGERAKETLKTFRSFCHRKAVNLGKYRAKKGSTRTRYFVVQRQFLNSGVRWASVWLAPKRETGGGGHFKGIPEVIQPGTMNSAQPGQLVSCQRLAEAPLTPLISFFGHKVLVHFAPPPGLIYGIHPASLARACRRCRCCCCTYLYICCRYCNWTGLDWTSGQCLYFEYPSTSSSITFVVTS